MAGVRALAVFIVIIVLACIAIDAVVWKFM